MRKGALFSLSIYGPRPQLRNPCKGLSFVKKKKCLINSCLTISFIFSLTLAIIFVVGIELWSPSLSIIRENKILLLPLEFS